MSDMHRIDIKGLDDDSVTEDGKIKFPSGLTYDKAEETKYLQGLIDQPDFDLHFKHPVGVPESASIVEDLEVRMQRSASVDMVAVTASMDDIFEDIEVDNLIAQAAFNDLIKALMLGKDFSQSVKLLMSDMQTEDIVEFKKLLPLAITHNGLVGKFYLVSSVFDECPNQISKYTKKLRTRFIEESDACESCNYNKDGMCLITKCDLIPVIDEHFYSIVLNKLPEFKLLSAEEIAMCKTNREKIRKAMQRAVEAVAQSNSFYTGAGTSGMSEEPIEVLADTGKDIVLKVKKAVSLRKPFEQINRFVKRHACADGKKALLDYGLAGCFYIDSEIHTSCTKASKMYKNRSYQVVKASSKCSGCGMRRGDMCGAYHAPVIPEVVYTDDLTNSYVYAEAKRDERVISTADYLRKNGSSNKEIVRKISLGKRISKKSAFEGHVSYVVSDLVPEDFNPLNEDVRNKALKLLNEGQSFSKVQKFLKKSDADTSVIEKELREVANLLGHIYIDSAYLPNDCRSHKCQGCIKPLYVFSSGDRCFECPYFVEDSCVCSVFELPIVTALEYTQDGVCSLIDDWKNQELITDFDYDALQAKKSNSTPKALLQEAVKVCGNVEVREYKKKSTFEIEDPNMDTMIGAYSKFWDK